MAANVPNCKNLQLESSTKLVVLQVMSAIGLFLRVIHEGEKPFGIKKNVGSYKEILNNCACNNQDLAILVS